MSHPARPQFQRLYDTGQIPVTGLPGSFAVNTADRKLWTFDAAGTPVPVAHRLDYHSAAVAYATGDVVIDGDTLYRARSAAGPGAFNPAQWDALAGLSTVAPAAPAGSGVLTGGNLVVQTGNTIQVQAGTGLITNPANPGAVTFSTVAWSGQTLVLQPSGALARAIAIDSAGAAVVLAMSAVTAARRTHIVLGYAYFDSSGELRKLAAQPVVSRQASTDVADVFAAMGGPFKLSGAVLAARSGLTVQVTGGTTFALHGRWAGAATDPSRVPFAASSPVVFDVISASGAVIEAGVTEIPSDQWEGGVLGLGYSTAHFLFSTPDGSKTWLQLGQTIYTGPAIAESQALNDYAAFQHAFDGAPLVLIGAVVVVRNAVDLTIPSQGRVLSALPGPEIALRFASTAAGSEILLTDGSNPMVGDLDVGDNAIINATIDEGVF